MIIHCHNYPYDGHTFCLRLTNPRSHIEFHRQHRKESTWTFDLTTFHLYSFLLTRDCLHPGSHPDHQHSVSDVQYGIRHSKSPIDATRALIGRVLVLMTLNPFERVAVSLKLVSILHNSSPPASLVFDVFFMQTNSRKTFENGI